MFDPNTTSRPPSVVQLCFIVMMFKQKVLINALLMPMDTCVLQHANTSVVKMILANKCDMEADRQVSLEKGLLVSGDDAPNDAPSVSIPPTFLPS